MGKKRRRKKKKLIKRQTDRHRDGQTDGHRHRQTGRQVDKTYWQTDRHTEICWWLVWTKK